MPAAYLRKLGLVMTKAVPSDAHGFGREDVGAAPWWLRAALLQRRWRPGSARSR